MGAWRGGLVALSSALVSSCILLISSPDEEGGAHCRFGGQDSLCGSCAREECRSEIDSCCGDTACAASLGALEGCASAHDATCDTLHQTEPGDDPAGKALRECIEGKCRGRCEPLTGVSTTHCEEPLLSGGTACRCQSAPGAANDHLCSTDVYPATLCCAPKNWPQPAVECSCRPVGCNATSDGGCICSLVDYTLPGLARECGGAHCCAAEDNCRCSAVPCESGQTVVASCSLAVLGCASGYDNVPACSLRQ